MALRRPPRTSTCERAADGQPSCGHDLILGNVAPAARRSRADPVVAASRRSARAGAVRGMRATRCVAVSGLLRDPGALETGDPPWSDRRCSDRHRGDVRRRRSGIALGAQGARPHRSGHSARVGARGRRAPGAPARGRADAAPGAGPRSVARLGGAGAGAQHRRRTCSGGRVGAGCSRGPLRREPMGRTREIGAGPGGLGCRGAAGQSPRGVRCPSTARPSTRGGGGRRHRHDGCLDRRVRARVEECRSSRHRRRRSGPRIARAASTRSRVVAEDRSRVGCRYGTRPGPWLRRRRSSGGVPTSRCQPQAKRST
jgi:hypothetical protein